MPFGILLSGRRPLTTPSQTPSPTSFIYTLPSTPAFSHIVVFLLPDIVLPPDTAAAVYLSIPPPAGQPAPPSPNFKFLGAIGEGKESAIFKVDGLLRPGGSAAGAAVGGENGEVDMDAPSPSLTSGEVTLGIDIEPASTVAAQLATLGQALVPTTRGAQGVQGKEKDTNETLLLAQKIIRHSFNYLASFGDQMIPLKAFEGWWAKFENRLRNEPGFLERVGD